jgi:hypothetical protein
MKDYWRYKRGSEWRKWDLHIHTPISIQQEYGGVQKWDKFIDALENLPSNVEVIGITDYYFIDGYEKVMEYRQKGRLQNLQKIFPVLEFRIDTFGSGNENKLQKINLHILFDLDETNLSAEISKVKTEFIGQIPITKLEKHKTKMLSIENLTKEGGNDLKKGFSDLIPPTDKAFELINSSTWKNKAFLFLGYKEWSNLEKNNQLKPLKEDLYSRVHAFLTSNIETLDKSQEWLNEYGNKKLLYSGDIHDFAFLDTANLDANGELSNSEKYKCNTWIKADPTFEGLKQIVYEPDDRIRIQALLPDPKNERHVISEIRYKSSDRLFGNQSILLNENLNSIIGGKSSGKTLLLHSIADSIDPEQVKRISKRLKFEGYFFENEKYDFEVKWSNGEIDILNDADLSNKTRKITYIPQLYINHLAEKNHKDELNNLINGILLQDINFKIYFEQEKDKISTISTQIENDITTLLTLRNDILDLHKQIKEIGSSTTIEKEIKQLENKIVEGQKHSALSDKEILDYNKLLIDKETLEAKLRLGNQSQSALNKIYREIGNARNNLFGFEDNDNQFDQRGQIDRILDEFTEIPEEILNLVKNLTEDFNSLLTKLYSDISNLKIQESINETNQSLRALKNKLSPFQKKLAGQKELQNLTEQLAKEKEKKIKSESLENQQNKSFIEYREVKNRIAQNLQTRFDTYNQIVDKTNATKSKIGDEITLSCSILFKKENFLLHDQANKASISSEHFFNDLFTNNFVKYDHIPDIFATVTTVTNETLEFSDDKAIPLRQKVTIEDVLRGLVIDKFEFDYKVTYKNDEILHMSPGKKGTVLLILFLQISSAEYPILIDQPEDNLDNRTIYDLLCTIIKEKKVDRQIIIVSHNAKLVARHNCLNGVGTQTNRVSLGLAIINCFCQHINLIVPHPPIATVALDLNYINAKINHFVNMLGWCFFFGMNLADSLEIAFENALVFINHIKLAVGNVHGVDARLFSKGQRFKNFLFGIVRFEKRRDVNQITRMRPASDKISAHNKPCYAFIAQLSLRQFPL